ncbi:MAG: 50S ribosomal protein L6 [Candidatus Woesearchaeota archaeon]
MTENQLEEKIELAKDVTVTVDNFKVTAKGPAGEVSKVLMHPNLTVRTEDGFVIVTSNQVGRREKMHIKTFAAHIRNLVKGASESFVYKLKICSGHFPMSASVKGDVFELKNFLGETVPRKLTLKPGAKVTLDGEFINVESVNKELAGQIAAELEKLTRITNRDRRIFQDGIFIVEKAGKEV